MRTKAPSLPFVPCMYRCTHTPILSSCSSSVHSVFPDEHDKSGGRHSKARLLVLAELLLFMVAVVVVVVIFNRLKNRDFSTGTFQPEQARQYRKEKKGGEREKANKGQEKNSSRQKRDKTMS